jgi:hypothetical protein
MTNTTRPESGGDIAQPQSDLSQVLAHGPALSTAYGPIWGGVLMLAAIMKVSRGPVGIAAAVTIVFTAIYNFWIK